MTQLHNKPPTIAVIPRLWRALGWSLAGLRAGLKYEQSLRIEVATLPFIIAMAWWLGSSPWHQVLLISAWLLLIMCELLNSALEATVDRISSDHHLLSGRAKDLGSAAVLIAFIINLLLWAAEILTTTTI